MISQNFTCGITNFSGSDGLEKRMSNSKYCVIFSITSQFVLAVPIDLEFQLHTYTYNQNVESIKIQLSTPLLTILLILNKICMQYLKNTHTSINCSKMVTTALSKDP